MSYIFSGFNTIFMTAWAAVVLAFLAVLRFDGISFSSNPKHRLLRALAGVISGMPRPFWIVFGIFFTFVGGAFIGFLILAIGVVGKGVIASIFSANQKRGILAGVFITLAALCVYEFYLLAPFVLIALYFTLTAKKRVEKSGIWNITHDNYTDAELGFAGLVMAREYLAPFFLLFLTAIMASGYFSNVVPHFLVTPGGIQTSLYNSRFAYSLVCLAWAVITAGTLSALHSFFAYFGMAKMFDATIQNLQSASAGAAKTIRGATKATGLQSKIDQQ